MLELADIDIEHGTAQLLAREGLGQRLLVDDLAARDIDQHASGLHQGEPPGIEQPVGFGRPLAADHDKIALPQEPVEVGGSADFGETRRQRFAGAWRPTGADNAHAEAGAQPSDIPPDAAGADHTATLAVELHRPVAAVVENPGLAVLGDTVEGFGEIKDAGDGEGAADAARGGHDDVAAPQIAAAQIAGAGRALMKPPQPRGARPQIERERPAAQDDFGRGQQSVAFFARAATERAGRQIARDGKGWPSLADLAVKPAAGIGEPNRRIARLDARPLGRARALDDKYVDFTHRYFRFGQNGPLDCRCINKGWRGARDRDGHVRTLMVLRVASQPGRLDGPTISPIARKRLVGATGIEPVTPPV